MNTALDVEFKVGRRAVDGIVRLSAHPPQLVQLSVSYKGERASSVVLTRSQLRALQHALAEFEVSLSADDAATEQWDLQERRLNEEVPEELTA